jgi:hypothetical protein
MSATKDTGGPAFPPTFPGRTDGMTLRDWFATHAPTDIPAWFSAGPYQPIPKVPGSHDALKAQAGWLQLTHADQNTLRTWMADAVFELSDGLAVIGWGAMKMIDEAMASAVKIQLQNEAQRYIAWRWAYADLMLKGREA